MLNARMFNISAGIGVAVLGLLAVVMMAAGQAFPIYLGNVGSFIISGDQLSADGFQLTLGVDKNSAEDGGKLPTGVNKIGSATIDNMILEKAFDVSSVIGNTSNPTWKVRMTSQAPVEVGETLIRMVGLCADVFEATNFEADAKGADTPQFKDDFRIRSEFVDLQGFGLEATYMATGSLQVRGLELVVTPGDYDKPACMP